MTSRAQLSVYLVEPDLQERIRATRALASHVRQVVAFDGGRDFLAGPPLDHPACIVVALALADMQTADFVVAARASAPVIVVGRVDDVSVAVEMIRAGAADVLDCPLDARRLRAAVRAAAASVAT